MFNKKTTLSFSALTTSLILLFSLFSSTFITTSKNALAFDSTIIDVQPTLGHTLILKSDGTIWIAGNNAYGQFGYNSVGNKAKPTQLPGLKDVKAISASHTYNLALKKDGTVWAWGMDLNDPFPSAGPDGQLPTILPTQIKDLSNITAISASGYYRALALKADGTVWSWGLNDFGEIGDGTKIDRITPVQVPNLADITAITAFGQRSLALKQDGTVWAWGPNVYGQPSNNTDTSHLKPVQVPELTDVVKIFESNTQSFALKNDGTLWYWGVNNFFIQQDTLPIPKPTLLYHGIKSIAAADDYLLLLKDDDTVWGVGRNHTGLLFIDDFFTPIPVKIDGLNDIEQIRIGVNCNFALRKDGTLLAWGENGEGQLGNGTFISPQTNIAPVFQTSTSSSIPSSDSSISAGVAHSLAVDSDGTVWAWGNNETGQLGLDSTEIPRQATPVKVAGLSDVISVSAGGQHSLALKKDGTVWAWGDNEYGQLGRADLLSSSSGVLVQGLTNIIAISANIDFNLALKADGTVWSWGANRYGQLGNGTNKLSTTPVQVKDLSGVIKLSAGSAFALALKNDGTVWSWGAQNVGELSEALENVYDVKTTPILIPELTNVVEISAGFSHSLAIKNDGTVWGWGSNEAFQLGDLTKSRWDTPIQVKNLADIKNISAGFYCSLATKTDGTIWSLGTNIWGQLGIQQNFDYVPLSYDPVQPSILKNVTAIDSGLGFNLARQAGGSLWAWGYNGEGQLGYGTLGGDANPAGETGHMGGISVPVRSLVDIGPSSLPIFTRLSGYTAPQTAIEIAKAGWANGAKTVLLATVDNFPDALAGAPLARELDAPILLTGSKQLTPDVKAEILRLNPERIIIVGGKAVVSEEIEKYLKQTYDVKRIAGWDQFETAAEIANYMHSINPEIKGKAVLAFGRNYPDVLSISAWAAYNKIPILLTESKTLPEATKEALTVLELKETIVVGGKAVISEEVAAQLPNVKRFFGLDQYQTGIAIANGLAKDISTVFIATGENFPDALAGSALAAKTGSPIILVDRNFTKSAVANYLSANAGKIKNAYILGGQAAVPQDTLTKLMKIIP